MPEIAVTIEQTGGFVGYLRNRVDSHDLTQDEVAELERLIEACELTQPAPASAEDASPSSPRLNVVIETKEKTFRVCPPGGKAGGAISQLVRYVRQKGKALGPP